MKTTSAKSLYSIRLQLLLGIRSPLFMLALTSLALVHCKSTNSSRKPAQIQNSNPNPVQSSSPTQSSTQQSTTLLINEGNSNYAERATDSQIAVFETGEDMFSYRWKLLENAKRSVRLQTFVFSGDEIGWLIAKKLVELKKKGLIVELMVDMSSSIALNDHVAYLYLLKNGIKVYGYHSYLYRKKSTDGLLENPIQIFDRLSSRAHEKLLIVDGEDPVNGVGIIGGTNIQNSYFKVSSDYKTRFTDLDVALRGGILQDLNQSFQVAYTKLKRSEAEFQNTGGNILEDTMNSINGTIGALVSESYLEKQMKPEVMARVNNLKLRTVNLSWKSAPLRYYSSAPTYGPSNIYQFYKDALSQARRSIVLSNAYFVPSQEFINLIHAALDRGVSVKILTNSPEASDINYPQFAGRNQYPTLFTHSNLNLLSLYEWGGHPNFGNNEGTHHAKFVVVDGELCFVGSFNIDARSQFLNTENGVSIRSTEVANILISNVERDTAPNLSNLLTLDRLKMLEDKYTSEEKMRRMLAILFSDLL